MHRFLVVVDEIFGLQIDNQCDKCLVTQIEAYRFPCPATEADRQARVDRRNAFHRAKRDVDEWYGVQ